MSKNYLLIYSEQLATEIVLLYQNIKAPILIHIAGNIMVLFLYEYSSLILVYALINLIISIYIIKQSDL